MQINTRRGGRGVLHQQRHLLVGVAARGADALVANDGAQRRAGIISLRDQKAGVDANIHAGLVDNGRKARSEQQRRRRNMSGKKFHQRIEQVCLEPLRQGHMPAGPKFENIAR